MRENTVILINITIAFSFVLSPFISFGMDAEIKSMLLQAAKKSEVNLDKTAIDFSVADFNKISENKQNELRSIPHKKIERTLADYFMTKKKFIDKNTIDEKNFSDFKWESMFFEYNYVPIKWNTSENIVIEKYIACDKMVKFTSPIAINKFLNNTITLPLGSCDFTIFGNSETRQFVWSSSGANKSFPVNMPMRTNYGKGCEIHLSSYPDKAEVYINGIKHYRDTNTKCATEPGKIRIIIKLAGYKEYTVEKTVEKGEVWIITANLDK
jgi:hypothetical protein